jgi:DNA polymerase-1
LAEDGHLHTSFNVHIAKTGRLSSSNPNLQNIPNIYKSPVEAKLIRDIFIPDEGHVLIHADYSQAEFRIWGQLSDDKALRRDLEAGMDVHTKVAMQGYNITAEVASTGDYRLNAKTVVFGNMYGRGLPSVAEQLGISLTQAQAIQDILFKNYPEAAKWLDDTKKQAKRDKYIVGLFGQKRHLSGLIDHWNKEIRAKAERQCVNSPIQGSASQMTCFAAIKIARALREHKLDARVILLIHDAIMVTARIDHRDKAIELMRECMLDPHPKVRIPLKVDVEVGPAWGTLSKLKKVLEEEALAIDNNNNQNNI